MRDPFGMFLGGNPWSSSFAYLFGRRPWSEVGGLVGGIFFFRPSQPSRQISTVGTVSSFFLYANPFGWSVVVVAEENLNILG